MGGFAVVYGAMARGWLDESARAVLLDSLSVRGRAVSEHLADERLSIVAVRDAWEAALHPGPMIAREGPITVVADATLYYLDDLRARLGRTTARPARTVAEYILRAYERYGRGCFEHIEGDFAFAVADDRSSMVLLARDPFGSRGVWYGSLNASCVAGSTPDVVRTVLGDRGLDDRELSRRLSFYTGRGTESVWRGVSELPAAHAVELGSPRSAPSRHWRPRIQPEIARLSLDEAAEALRGVLGRAVEERVERGATAIAMSGGRDSTALVGALATYTQSTPLGDLLRVLSLRYPEDDPGNEDEHVRSVSASLGLPVEWLETEEIPLVIDDPPDWQRRSEPEAHPYEGQNLAIAGAASAGGATVLLNGHGGDNIFAATPMWPADLLREGRWFRFVSELRARRLPLWRSSRDYYFRAAAPEPLLQLAERWRGKALFPRPWTLPRVPWLRLADEEWEVLEQEHRALYFEDPWEGGGTISRWQRRWALAHSSFARINAALNTICRAAGVELRMPLFDRRVVEFAWSREAADLCGVKEHKLLLTQTMHGVLPDSVTAPRARRTGTADGYSYRHFRRFLDASAARGERVGSSLAARGLVEPSVLADAVAKVRQGGTEDALPLLVTIGVDRWLMRT